MLVVFKRDFFGPDHALYLKNVKGTEVPDEFRGKLPRDAKVFDGKSFVAADAPAPSLRDMDVERANGAGIDKANEAANAAIETARREKALALKKQADAEKK